jgi:hypothetical protein
MASSSLTTPRVVHYYSVLFSGLCSYQSRVKAVARKFNVVAFVVWLVRVETKKFLKFFAHYIQSELEVLQALEWLDDDIIEQPKGPIIIWQRRTVRGGSLCSLDLWELYNCTVRTCESLGSTIFKNIGGKRTKGIHTRKQRPTRACPFREPIKSTDYVLFPVLKYQLDTNHKWVGIEWGR